MTIMQKRIRDLIKNTSKFRDPVNLGFFVPIKLGISKFSLCLILIVFLVPTIIVYM